MTAASREEAGTIADMLVENQLAACVQILPAIESVYRWQGSIERSSEVLLLAKTELGKFAELERQVRAMHSYETPEIVAVPVTAISQPYSEWLNVSLERSEGD
ncbi:MAG: divalent-cation tolerance protein CutA [Acidobacteriota bacterium]|nr:divalent-cation tolerance protein CutA [Acidobacteriota bacterium]